MDWPGVRVWQLFSIEWAVTLIILVLVLPSVRAAPPTVTTDPATGITFDSAILHGNVTNLGNGTVTSVSVRQFAHNRCTGTSCAATFSMPTIANNTLVVIVSSQGGSHAPTDDGGNSYSGWAVGDVSGSQLFQLPLTGASDEPDLIAIYGTTNPTTVITAHDTGNPSALFIAELSKSIPFHATMTAITNTPTNVYGVSANHSYGFLIGDLEMNALTGSCGSFGAYEGSKIDTYEGPTLLFECSYLMKNTTGGTHISVTNSNGMRSENVIQLRSAASADVGFLWGTSPTLAGATNVSVATISAAGTFSRSLFGLAEKTTYYFRSWALNSQGFSTGSILSFTTEQGTSQFVNPLIIFAFLALLCIAVVGALWIRRRVP